MKSTSAAAQASAASFQLTAGQRAARRGLHTVALPRPHAADPAALPPGQPLSGFHACGPLKADKTAH